MTDDLQALSDAATDGPNTHKYRDATFVTSWHVFRLTDPEGVEHVFHVPSRIVEQIEIVMEAGRAATPVVPVEGLREEQEANSVAWHAAVERAQAAASPSPDTDRENGGMGLRDRLADTVLAALDEPSMAGYRLPERPSDLAYTVVDAILAAGLTVESGETLTIHDLRPSPDTDAGLNVEQGWALHGYPVVLYQEPEDGSWSVLAPDLPGFVAADITIGGALHEAEDAMAAWLDTYRDDHGDVPTPSDPHTWSVR